MSFCALDFVRGGTVATVAAAAVGLTACGGSAQTLDSARIERAIEKSILKQRGLHSEVSCPRGIKQKKGTVFSCAAKLKSGTTRFVVTLDDAHGAAHWVGVRR